MATDVNKHFGKEIRRFREVQKLSQLNLAERARVDLSTINRIERGIANTTLRRAFNICKALHVPFYKFFLTDKRLKKLDRRGKIQGTPVD